MFTLKDASSADTLLVMRTSHLTVSVGVIALLLPTFASAHQHGVYQIGDKQYSIAVGTFNEPAIVDSPSGAEFIISELSAVPVADAPTKDAGDGDDDGPSGTPVTGLEATIKVQISAAGSTKTLALEPEYGKAGSYVAAFIPSAKTTYTYHFVGKINSTAVDLAYSCNPAGHALAADDTTPKPMGEGVTRLSDGGSFGCPTAKADLSFPDAIPSTAELATAVQSSKDAGSSPLVYAAPVISVLSFAGMAAMSRKR